MEGAAPKLSAGKEHRHLDPAGLDHSDWEGRIAAVAATYPPGAQPNVSEHLSLVLDFLDALHREHGSLDCFESPAQLVEIDGESRYGGVSLTLSLPCSASYLEGGHGQLVSQFELGGSRLDLHLFCLDQRQEGEPLSRPTQDRAVSAAARIHLPLTDRGSPPSSAEAKVCWMDLGIEGRALRFQSRDGWNQQAVNLPSELVHLMQGTAVADLYGRVTRGLREAAETELE